MEKAVEVTDSWLREHPTNGCEEFFVPQAGVEVGASSPHSCARANLLLGDADCLELNKIPGEFQESLGSIEDIKVFLNLL